VNSPEGVKRKTILYLCLRQTVNDFIEAPPTRDATSSALPIGSGRPTDLGGSHGYERRLAEALTEKYDVLIAFFTRLKDSKPNRRSLSPKSRLFPIRDFPIPQAIRLPYLLMWPLETAIRTVRVALAARILRPDLLYGNWLTYQSGLYCAFARFHPFLVNAWGTDLQIEAKKSRLLRLFAKLTIRTADTVIVDSEVQRKDLLRLGCDPRKICCFPWGIDLDKFKPRNSTGLRRELDWLDKKIVLSTRRHVERCGVEYLIRAIPQISERETEARFLIAGDGPLLERHKALAKSLGIEDKVRFLGWVQNNRLPEILNAADVFVSSSFSDGTSGSLLEAMACGLSVVVTAIPGNKEWVSQGRNGLLVSPGDSEELARAILRVLQDNEMRLRMREANLKIARERADWNLNALVLQRCVSQVMISSGRKTSIGSGVSYELIEGAGVVTS